MCHLHNDGLALTEALRLADELANCVLGATRWSPSEHDWNLIIDTATAYRNARAKIGEKTDSGSSP